MKIKKVNLYSHEEGLMKEKITTTTKANQDRNQDLEGTQEDVITAIRKVTLKDSATSSK